MCRVLEFCLILSGIIFQFPYVTVLCGVIYQTLHGNKSKLMNLGIVVIIFTGNLVSMFFY